MSLSSQSLLHPKLIEIHFYLIVVHLDFDRQLREQIRSDIHSFTLRLRPRLVFLQLDSSAIAVTISPTRLSSHSNRCRWPLVKSIDDDDDEKRCVD